MDISARPDPLDGAVPEDPSSTPEAATLDRRSFVRASTLAVGGLGLAGLLAACGSSTKSTSSASSGAGSSTSASAAAGGTSSAAAQSMTIAISGTQAASENNWRATFAAFAKVNPSITVNTLFVNANNWVEFFSALETRIAGGQQVDAIYVPTEGMQLFASRGLINPLDTYIAGDKAYVQALYDDIDPNLLAGFKQHDSYQGKTYYLPYAFNTTCIFYSKSIFKAHNVAAPPATWTWTDFRDICSKVSDTSKRQYGWLFNVDVWGGFEPWLTTNGAKLLNADWTKSAIDSPATVEAFTFCRSLVADNLAPAPALTSNALQLLKAGNIAMYAGGVVGQTTLSQYGLNLDDLGILQWPRMAQQGASVGIGSIAMLTASKSKDAVWELIKYVTSPEQQQAGGGGTVEDGQLPIRTSASTSQAVLSQIPEGAASFWKMLSYAQMVPGTNNATAMEGAMNTTWSQMLTGAISPAAAATQMASSITTNL